MAKRKKGMTFIPYDYEAAYNKSLEDMHEFFVEQMFKQGKKVVYALKEIRAGDQFEVEIYPQFKKMDEVPPEGRSIKKDNDKAQRNLNDKNARKYVERLINENFTDRDLWLTFTYDNEHLPPDGDIDAAIKNVQKFIRRVNYQRKKRGLPNARYVYVTAYNPTEEIRWHHHIVMDGDGCEEQFDEETALKEFNKDSNAMAIMQQISAISKQKKELEEKEKEVRAALEAAMGQFGIKSFENDILKVTYVAPTKKTTIDSKALKKDHPDVYEKYAKTSDVKASVRITVKD